MAQVLFCGGTGRSPERRHPGETGRATELVPPPRTWVVRISRLIVDYRCAIVIADVVGIFAVIADDLTYIVCAGVGDRAVSTLLHVGRPTIHGAVVGREGAVAPSATMTVIASGLSLLPLPALAIAF